jgi:hypothetical protein
MFSGWNPGSISDCGCPSRIGSGHFFCSTRPFAFARRCPKQNRFGIVRLPFALEIQRVEEAIVWLENCLYAGGYF